MSLISVRDIHVTNITSTEFCQNYRNMATACEDISVLHYDFWTWKDETKTQLFQYIKYIQ